MKYPNQKFWKSWDNHVIVASISFNNYEQQNVTQC